MSVILIAASGFIALAVLSVVGAAVRRRFGRQDAATSAHQRMAEAEIITRTGGPFV